MIELKPCPFCGGEATIEQWWQSESGTVYYVKCNSQSRCPGCRITTAYSSFKEAVDMWNRRCEEDALRARIAELEAAQRWKPVEPDSWNFHPYPCEVRYDANGKITHFRQSPPEDK